MAKPVPDPRVSVVTAAYNAAPFIVEAVKSVQAQTRPPLEHIIVDDGSDDSTGEIVESLGLPGVRVFSVEHRGAPFARNVGIGAALGERIAFLDADDRWHPTFLEQTTEALNAADDDVSGVFSQSVLITQRGNPVGHIRPPAGRYGLWELFAGTNPAGNGSCLLLERKALEEVGGFDDDLSSAQELDLLLRIAAHSSAPWMVAVGEELVDYRLSGSGSISGKVDVRLSKPNRLLALDHFLNTYSPYFDDALLWQAYVMPTIFALLGGAEDTADRWWAGASAAGWRALASHQDGRRLLAWHVCGRRGRVALRHIRTRAMALAIFLCDQRWSLSTARSDQAVRPVTAS